MKYYCFLRSYHFPSSCIKQATIWDHILFSGEKIFLWKQNYINKIHLIIHWRLNIQKTLKYQKFWMAMIKYALRKFRVMTSINNFSRDFCTVTKSELLGELLRLNPFSISQLKNVVSFGSPQTLPLKPVSSLSNLVAEILIPMSLQFIPAMALLGWHLLLSHCVYCCPLFAQHHHWW